MDNAKIVTRNGYRVAAVSLLLCLLAVSAHSLAADKSKLVITVLAEQDSAAIPDAHILITGPNDLDLTANTDTDGKATVKNLPRDEITVQVIATGFENYGKRLKLSKKEKALVVMMKKREELPAKATAEPAPP